MIKKFIQKKIGNSSEASYINKREKEREKERRKCECINEKQLARECKEDRNKLIENFLKKSRAAFFERTLAGSDKLREIFISDTFTCESSF